MKKTSLLILLLISTNVMANELQSFSEIKSAATTGKSIHIVIDFLKCTSSGKAFEPVSIGIFTPNAMLIVNNHIAASLKHFTLNNPGFPGKPIYEFLTYTIASDNMVNLTAQPLDAVNYAPLSDKLSFNCKIGTGAKIYD